MDTFEGLITSIAGVAAERWYTGWRSKSANESITLDEMKEDAEYKRYINSAMVNSYDEEKEATNGEVCKDEREVSVLLPITRDRKRRAFGEMLERDKSLRNQSRHLVPGQKAHGSNKHIRRFNIPTFGVPSEIFEHLERKEFFDSYYPILNEPLSEKNYINKFKVLLFLEEARTRIEMRQYDMDNVVFQRAGTYLELEVPGIVDSRPSLLIGDTIIIEQPNVTDKPKYEGHIHCVSIHLPFDNHQ